MEDDEIEKYPKFEKIISSKYPKLKWKLIYIYHDNTKGNEIYKMNNYLITNNSIFNKDLNTKIDNSQYNYFMNYIKKNNIIYNFDNFIQLPPNVNFKNSQYMGWAIKEGIYPYDIDN
jgi:hypothetical protein